MSNTPNARYDWGLHLPKMIHLYESGMSIPEIHKEIQDETTGFTPSQRMVYKKFSDEGYSKNKPRRDDLLKAHGFSRQSSPGGQSSNSRQALPANLSNHSLENSYALANSAAVAANLATQRIDASGTWEDTKVLNVQYDAASLDIFAFGNDFDYLNGFGAEATNMMFPTSTTDPSELPAAVDADRHPHTFLDMAQSPSIAQSSTFDTIDIGNLDWTGTEVYSHHDGVQSNQPLWPLNETTEHHPQSKVPASDPSHETPHGPFLSHKHRDMGEKNIYEAAQTCQESSPKLDHLCHSTNGAAHREDRDTFMEFCSRSNDGDSDNLDSQNDTPVSRSSSLRSKSSPSPVGSSSSSARMVSWLHPKPRPGLKHMYNRSCTPEKRDSGYSSGRNTPMMTLAEEGNAHPRSLTEFKRLYRVPCKDIHEPQPLKLFFMPESQSMGRFKDVPTCTDCRYSGIHNLGWSVRYLKFEVFQLELRLENYYDITALDMAGNSALHYAAAGGAGFEHFAALIEAGVNPYQINTAGHLFLHCLRPYIKDEGPKDADEIAVFNSDLVSLLNKFQSEGVFRWRDNEGRTVLDAIACNITDADVKAQMFRAVKDAGYPLEDFNRFSQARTPLERIDHLSLANHADFNLTQSRQDKAYDLLRRARMEPSYVDPDTGDNALHALAKIKMPERRALLTKIQEYVLKDVDLNQHNRQRDSPLAAFIMERPFLGKEDDETGATLSKYLDALLWKDARQRIPNKINVNMRNREGATALYYAAIRARPDSVRSLVEAGANVNARLDIDGHRISILQAAMRNKARAVHDKNELKIYQFNEVISYLEHANAVVEPTLLEERAVCENSVRMMPI